jgi:hypothetical protein
MRDLVRLIVWMVTDLFRSRAALEAEILTLRQQISVSMGIRDRPKATSFHGEWLHGKEPRAVGDLVHVETFFARNLGGLIHARSREPVRLGKATSRTPSMYVDEKSDEAIILAKRLNKGRQLAAEVAEGRASPEGNSGP